MNLEKELKALGKWGMDYELFPFYTKQAMAKRWGLTRQAVNDRNKRHSDFPRPVEGLIKGGGPYYPLYEILKYERERGLKVHE